MATGALLAASCADAPPVALDPTTETTDPNATVTTSTPTTSGAAPTDATPIRVPSAVESTDSPRGDDASQHCHEYGGEDHHHHSHMHACNGVQPRDGHHHVNSGVSVHGDIHTHPHLDPHAGSHHEHPHTHMSPLELGLVFLEQMGFPEDLPEPPSSESTTTSLASTTTTTSAPEEDDRTSAMLASAMDAFALVYGSASPFSAAAPHLESAESLEATYAEFVAFGSSVGGIEIKPTAASLDGDMAMISYDVYVGGEPFSTGSSGAMWLRSGIWIASRGDFCAGMEIAGISCATR